MADYHLSHEMVAGVALCEETNTSGHEEICRPSDLFTGSKCNQHGLYQQALLDALSCKQGLCCVLVHIGASDRT